MNKLTKDCFYEAGRSIMEYGRPLEKNIYQMHFNGGAKQAVINELKKFQNKDGGFGYGLESDFRLPYSSPMATSVGLRILSEMDESEDAKASIKAAVRYLEASFDSERNGWFVASKEINDFPHAPWWHYNEENGMTIIDKNWGNPSAELLAYLYKYREYAGKLDVDSLVEYAVAYIENKQKFNSENEVNCYIKLYNVLHKPLQSRLEKRILAALEQVIEQDENKWHEYVPTPLDFVKSPSGNRFGITDDKIEHNLEFIVNELESNGKIYPHWGDSFYKGDLKEAYNEWIGVLTLKALVTLDNFNRIER